MISFSNNKFFKNFLYRQSTLERKSLADTEFIVKCRNKWKLMDQKDKLLYANHCEGPNIGFSPNEGQSSNQVMSSGRGFEEIEEEENILINTLVKYKSKNELMDTKFFLMSSNIQCVAKKEYRPLEIGLIEYTIRDGICGDYHQFIDCGDVPYGYAFEALDHMKRYHKIPLKDFTMSSNDYVWIGSRILDMLSDSCVDDEQVNHYFNRPMIVFSSGDQIDQNKGVLQWISNCCNEMRILNKQKAFNFNIKVLKASKLFSSLLTAAGDCHSVEWCEDAITSSAFDYTEGTDCRYHEDIQCLECAIGVPKRMAYSMSDFLRKPYNITISVKHLPKVFSNLRISEDNEEKKAFPLSSDQISTECGAQEGYDSSESETLIAKQVKEDNTEDDNRMTKMNKSVSFEDQKEEPLHTGQPLFRQRIAIGIGRAKPLSK